MKATIEISVTERGKKVPQYIVGKDLSGELSLAELLQYTKATLLSVALEALRDEQSRGFDIKPVVRVDNRIGKAPSDVHPFGKIEFTSRADMKDIVLYAYDSVYERSAVDTGLYQRSHIVSFNSRVIAQTREELIQWFSTAKNLKDGDRFRIINVTPYAHKLERYAVHSGKQRIKQRPSKDKARAAKGVKVLKPNGTYVLASYAIRRKYKNNSSIKFELLPGNYLGIQSIHIVGPKGPMRNSYLPKKKGGQYNSGSYLYPTIVIAVQGGGINE